MSNPLHFDILIQYIVPQRFLSRLMGWLCECRWRWLKNWMIKRFIRKYHVDITAARSDNIEDYPNFNSFFTRLLKPELRPITQDPQQIACPADGYISQTRKIQHQSLFQAKGFYFNLKDLLGGSEKLAKTFDDGNFATIYLSPKDYHRVHMPFTGQLRETIYIPGKLFSVNQKTTHSVANLFARNERLVCIFDTKIGPMAILMVGAMLVSSINTVWDAPIISRTITTKSYSDPIHLERGAELGYFKMGSTVIVVFTKDQIEWSKNLLENTVVQMGQPIGKIQPK